MAGAWRMVNGQVIYRDFFEFFAPGNFFLLALVYKLFGYSLVITNKALIVIDVICNILLFQISYMVLRRWYAIVPPLLFLIVGFPSWFILSHYWTTSVTLFAALVWLIMYLERLTEGYRSPAIYLFLSGLFVGLTGIFLQSAGVYTALVLLIVLYLRTKKIPGRVKRILTFGIGISLPVLTFALYLFLNNAFVPFIHTQISLLEMYPSAAYFFSKPLLSLYNILTPVKLMFLTSFVGSLILIAFKRNTSDTEFVFFAGNILFFLDTWHWLTMSNNVLDPSHTTSGMSFVFIMYLVVLFVEYIKNHCSGSMHRLVDVLTHGAFLTVTVIIMVLAYKGMSDIRTKAFHFVLHDTAYWTYDGKGANDLVKFSSDAEKMLGNDKDVFVYPLASTLYTLLGLKNTTDYDIIVSFGQIARAPSEISKDVIHQLVSSKTKFIITYQWSYRFLVIWSQRNGVIFKPNILERFLWDNYHDVLHVGMYTLWELNTLVPKDVLSECPMRISRELVSVSVSGATTRTGSFDVNVGARLMDALSMAGGPLPVSDLRRVIILRHGRTIQTDFLRYLQTRDPVYNPLLKDNDAIYVPRSAGSGK
ncbi:MAG: SLBB domain-containing protein [Deltaproteobacteria bacterium]|nr:SLBB domain-containing protein [Deltaproteobacteria bacterium]MCL5277728.1 SLBB domain-containing protein [Deltaproteobacteria bacterium]